MIIINCLSVILSSRKSCDRFSRSRYPSYI